jgi:hypothetical protein
VRAVPLLVPALPLRLAIAELVRNDANAAAPGRPRFPWRTFFLAQINAALVQ